MTCDVPLVHNVKNTVHGTFHSFVRTYITLLGACRLISREQKPEWNRQGIQVVFTCLSPLLTLDRKQNNRCMGYARPTSRKLALYAPHNVVYSVPSLMIL